MRFIARFRARFIARSHVRFRARFIARSHVRFRARFCVRSIAGGSQTLSGFSNLSKYFVCRNSRILFRDFYFLFFHTIFILEFENLGLYIFIEFICRIIHNNIWNLPLSIYYANREMSGISIYQVYTT